MSSARPIPIERTKTPRTVANMAAGDLKFGRVFTDHMFLADWEGGDGGGAGTTRAWSRSARSACRRRPPACTTGRACSTG